MKTPLGRLRDSIADVRMLVGRLAEADRTVRAARSGLETVLQRVHPIDVRRAAQAAAEAEIRTRRHVHRRNVAAELRSRGSQLVALAAEADAMLSGLALRIERDDTFLVADSDLFETKTVAELLAEAAS